MKLVEGEGQDPRIIEQLKMLEPIINIIKAGNFHTLVVMGMFEDGRSDCWHSSTDPASLALIADQFDDYQRAERDVFLYPELGEKG